jgi:hypothetical protein
MMPKKLIGELNLGKVFIKPSQSIFGIRHAGRPNWDKKAETEVLEVIWEGMRTMAPSALCLGEKGKNFFKCLKEKSDTLLPHAGISGIWYAAAMKGNKAKALEVLEERFVYGWSKPRPDTARANGRRLAHAILAGLGLEDALKMVKIPNEMIDENIAKAANAKAGNKLSDADIKDIINNLKTKYVDEVVSSFEAFRMRFRIALENEQAKQQLYQKLPPYIVDNNVPRLLEVNKTELETAIRKKLGMATA